MLFTGKKPFKKAFLCLLIRRVFRRAIDAANYLIYLTRESFDDMSNMKINKLLYYCQGYFLKEHGRPLFDDVIEAWEHGPVVPFVYSAYKKYGDKNITVCDEASINTIAEEEKEIISLNSIEEYFQGQEDIVLTERKFTENDFVGYRDEKGILVLPKEWDDEEV